MEKRGLYQPVITRKPEASHSLIDVLSLQSFLVLLKEEEDYYTGDQCNTKLMITRLRKIFYDIWGWNTELIRGAAEIEGRYEVKIVDDAEKQYVGRPSGRSLRVSAGLDVVHKRRIVCYKPTDRVYPDRAGQIPFIYDKDHQELVLPEGVFCDIAHVLAGLDAINYKAHVAPLPNWLMWARKIFPYNESNVDIVTWLGDIASASGDFVFEYLNRNRKINDKIRQDEINSDAPGSDMLGDIDPYVIACCYDISSSNGLRVTDILQDYYCGESKGKYYREHRFSIFCEQIGLGKLDGEYFEKEKDWMKFYIKQLRNGTTFCEFSQLENIKGAWIALRTWLHCFEDVMVLEELLEIFLKELKDLVRREPMS